MWLSVLLQLLMVISKCNDIEPWTTNSTAEYYLFYSRPYDEITRNLTCHTNNCVIGCFYLTSCQKFNIHGGNANNIELECNYPEIKELRPGSCWRANIFTQNANNFNAYCSNENCAETKFFVNHTNYSYFIFDGDWAAKFAYIDGSEIQYNLTIICNDTESCSDITIYCPSMSECNINCNGSKACNNANIYLGNDNYDYLNLNCNHSDTSCNDITIHCLDKTSNKLWYDTIDNVWKCFHKTECCPFQHKHNHIKCEDNKECIIHCDKQRGCNWAIIDASNANSLQLICNKENQCKITSVICPSHNNHNTTSCTVQCNGRESCKFMNISSSLLSQLNIECRSRASCQNMMVNVIINGNINIQCDNEWSCGNAKFEIIANNQNNNDNIHNILFINCNDRYSCEGITVYCPFQSIYSCLIRCNDYDNSCGGLHFFASKSYQYDYLQIQCPEKTKSLLKPCNFMKVICDENKSTVLRYIDNNKIECSNHECCPWKQINKDDQDTIYSTIIAILCCLATMYLLTVGCNIRTDLK